CNARWAKRSTPVATGRGAPFTPRRRRGAATTSFPARPRYSLWISASWGALLRISLSRSVSCVARGGGRIGCGSLGCGTGVGSGCLSGSLAPEPEPAAFGSLLGLHLLHDVVEWFAGLDRRRQALPGQVALIAQERGRRLADLAGSEDEAAHRPGPQVLASAQPAVEGSQEGRLGAPRKGRPRGQLVEAVGPAAGGDPHRLAPRPVEAPVGRENAVRAVGDDPVVQGVGQLHQPAVTVEHQTEAVGLRQVGLPQEGTITPAAAGEILREPHNGSDHQRYLALAPAWAALPHTSPCRPCRSPTTAAKIAKHGSQEVHPVTASCFLRHLALQRMEPLKTRTECQSGKHHQVSPSQ